jgi:hypothetical protein
MVRLFPIWDAKQVQDENRRTLDELSAQHRQAVARAEAAESKLDAAYTMAFDGYLTGFAHQFSRLHNVDLGLLPTVNAFPELESINIEVRQLGVSTVNALAAAAGGTLAGAAVSAITFAGVSALATAGTGAAIAGLSGAAATSAPLAWLGGGTLAAGGAGVAGGTAVLASLVAAPAVLALGGFLWWKGEQAYQQQVRLREELKLARSEFEVQMTFARRARTRVIDTAKVIRKLAQLGEQRLQQLSDVIDQNDDYATFKADEKVLVAELAGLATTIAAVIACPIIQDGAVTTLSDDTMKAAQAATVRLAA